MALQVGGVIGSICCSCYHLTSAHASSTGSESGTEGTINRECGSIVYSKDGKTDSKGDMITYATVDNRNEACKLRSCSLSVIVGRVLGSPCYPMTANI
jgi:hypothetical protein